MIYPQMMIIVTGDYYQAANKKRICFDLNQVSIFNFNIVCEYAFVLESKEL